MVKKKLLNSLNTISSILLHSRVLPMPMLFYRKYSLPLTYYTIIQGWDQWNQYWNIARKNIDTSLCGVSRLYTRSIPAVIF